MPSAASVDLDEIRRLRRDLRRVAPEVARQLDRDLKKAGNDAVVLARGYTPRKTGRLGNRWIVSVAQRLGVALRNTVEYAGQHEYGRQIWLRRGVKYRDDTPGAAPAFVGRGIRLRQVRLEDGWVVNEARYLIQKSRPGHRAAELAADRAIPEIEAAAARAADRALS